MHRVIVHTDTGEERTIEYASRLAAFKHFSAIALARHTHRASIEKHDDEREGIWIEVAHMSITNAGNA